MEDKRFFYQPVRHFSYPNPKQKCNDYLNALGIQLVIITLNCKTYITGGLIPLVQLITSCTYNQRCYFEIIPPATPAKLYFDIDHNGPIDLQAYAIFEELFIETVQKRLETDHYYKDWDTNCEPLILKSNGDHKHSVHYIFPVVFQNVSLMKGFVFGVVGELQANPFAKSIDTGVYTSWRNFRMVQNTKQGKQNHLVLQNNSQNIFQQTLQCFVSVMRIKSYKHIHPDLDFLFNCKKIITTTSIQADVLLSRSASLIGSSCVIPDKYKKIVETVESAEIAKKFPNHSYSRSFQHFNGNDYVDYVFNPGLPCPANGGKVHKSNKTYFKIDFRRGTVFYRCADPECSTNQFDVTPLQKLASSETATATTQRIQNTAQIRGYKNRASKRCKTVGSG